MNKYYSQAAQEDLSRLGRNIVTMLKTEAGAELEENIKLMLGSYRRDSQLAYFDNADRAEVKLGFKPLKINVA